MDKINGRKGLKGSKVPAYALASFHLRQDYDGTGRRGKQGSANQDIAQKPPAWSGGLLSYIFLAQISIFAVRYSKNSIKLELLLFLISFRPDSGKGQPRARSAPLGYMPN